MYFFEPCANQNADILILVNGLFADYKSYDPFVFYLKDHFHILRFNCLGQDLISSDQCSGNVISLNAQVEHLKNILLKFENDFSTFRKKYKIFGLSNGGRIALKFATKFPEKISQLILMNTYSNPSPLLKMKLNSWLSAHKMGGPVFRFEVTAPWIWGESFYNQKSDLILKHKVEIEKNQHSSLSIEVEGLILGALEVDEFDFSMINCRVDIFSCEEDLLTPINYHEQLKKNILNSKLHIIKNVGHAGVIENPMLAKEILKISSI